MPAKGSIPRTCEECGLAFSSRPSAVANGRGKFCSDACAKKHRADAAKSVLYSCEQCGQTYHRNPVQVGRFCSIDCYRASQTPETRFWKYVDKSGECWMWTGTKGGPKREYGYFSLTTGSKIGAHRASWILHYGEIPEGLFVMHRCDNPGCVRPEHLMLGTPQDNTLDMFQKGRARPQGKRAMLRS